MVIHISYILMACTPTTSLDPTSGGRRKQGTIGRRMQQGSLEPEGRDERVRMEEGKRCSWPAAHMASAADGWRLGVRTEEVRERVRRGIKEKP